MMDETIAPQLYRTGRGDRSIPLVLAILLVLISPILAWAAGPYLWPWGAIVALSTLGGGLGTLRRWRTATRSVVWDEAGELLEFRAGKHRRQVPLASLTKVEVRPSSARTRLWMDREHYTLSHRLVRAEVLLEKLRSRRPDLFAPSGDTLKFRRSSASAVFQALLALGTGGAGGILWGWQPGVGMFFVAASVYVLVRILFFIPRAYEISHERLTTRYWLRFHRWGRPLSIREEGYAAGGAVFFRVVLDYGAWNVVLDEGQLVDSLRPWADSIVHRLRPPVVG